MKETMTNPWMLSIAGLLTWLVAGLPVLGSLAASPERFAEPRYLVWLAAFTLFGVIFWKVSRGDEDEPVPLAVFVGLQIGAVLVAMAAFPNGLGSVLLVITASQFAWLAPLRGAVLLVVAQTAAAMLIGGWRGDWPLLELLFNAGIYLGFQLFALFTSYTALKEAEGRAQLAQLNAELRAAQALLAESSRLSERLRIARELHDLIGHQLTALSLNLEVASHLTDGKAKTHIETTQGLAKGLLSDVREAVGSLRAGGLDLSGALDVLVGNIPNLKVHLESGVQVDDPQRALVLLRVVQEVVTNTVRHARAENLWLALEPTAEGVRLSARDDGHGAPALRPGNGLTGMQERVETLGGQLELHPNPGRGFALTATLPV